MEENREMPLISVIVPVYNGELYIKRCLESLFGQTYENLEVIVVDDGSTDHTAEILEESKKKWGERLQVYHIENSGQGRARTEGIRHAKGSLLGFCDADDYLKREGIEVMERTMHSAEADLLYAPLIRESDGFFFNIGEIAPPYTKSNIIRKMRLYGFPNLLVKKRLMEELGDIPAIVYEDIAYVGALMTRSQKIAYLETPVYYYVNMPGSVVNSKTNPRILELREAIDWAIAHASEDGRQELIMALAKKCTEKIGMIWYYGDRFLEKLQDMQPLIEENPFYQKYPNNYQAIKEYLKLPKEPFPAIVYIDGISGEISDAYLEEIKSHVFRDGAEAVVLTEETAGFSDLMQDKKAAAAYCAMKKILETGGIYVGRDIRIRAPFDCMRHYRAFFGYEDDRQFTVQLFGGHKEDPVLQGVYESWTELLSGNACGLTELGRRLTEFLISEYGVKALGESTYTEYPFATLAPTVVMLDYEENKFHLCEKVYEDMDIPEGMKLLSEGQIKALVNMPASNQAKKIVNQRSKIARMEFLVRQQKKEIKKLQKETESDAYQAFKKMRKYKLGRLIIKVLKCLFK